MTLTVDLPPELEARLMEAAQQRSVSVETLAATLLARAPTDPFLLALLLAEDDDEPVTAEDLADIDHTIETMRAGTGVPHAEVVRRFQPLK